MLLDFLEKEVQELLESVERAPGEEHVEDYAREDFVVPQRVRNQRRAM